MQRAARRECKALWLKIKPEFELLFFKEVFGFSWQIYLCNARDGFDKIYVNSCLLSVTPKECGEENYHDVKTGNTLAMYIIKGTIL